MFPTAENVPNDGLYSSALAIWPRLPLEALLLPPVIKTVPPGSSVAL